MCLHSAPLTSLPRAAFHLQGTHQPDRAVTAPTSYRGTWLWTHGTPWEPDLGQESIYLVVPIWSYSNGAVMTVGAPVSHSP